MSTQMLFGVNTYSLSDGVDIFMSMQGNVKRSHFLQYMVTGQTVWEHLFKNSIWAIHQQVVNVTTDSHGKKTFRMPDNIMKVLSISVVDKHGNLQPLTMDQNMNTLEISCHPKTCSCGTCGGKNTLCEALDSIGVRYESIVIDGQTYEKTIWTKKTGCDIIEHHVVPVKEDGVMTHTDLYKTICTLDVDTQGCIKETEPNRHKLFNHFGWYRNCFCNNFFNVVENGVHHHHPDLAMPVTHNDYGYYKPDAMDPQKMHLNHTKAEQVIVVYQPSIIKASLSELRIPEYAKECFLFGMGYFTVAFDRVTPGSMKVLAENSFTKSERALMFFMNPVRIKEFLMLPGIEIKWG